MCPMISKLLWVQERLLCRNDDPVETQRVSRNLLMKGGWVAGRVQVEGTAWLKVLRQEGAGFMRR